MTDVIDGTILQDETSFTGIAINNDTSGDATVIDSNVVELVSVPVEVIGRTILEFPFFDVRSFLAVHNYGRLAVVSIFDTSNRRIYCQEIHTLNSVQVVSRKPISGVIVCV